MDFWQLSTLIGLVVAITIGCSEIYQVWLQRKVLTDIRDLMAKIDVETTLDRIGSGTDAVKLAIKEIDFGQAATAIGQELKTAIREYGQSIDIQAIIDSLASSLTEHMKEAVPEMVEQAGSEAMKEKAKYMKQAQKDPFGAFHGRAMERIANKPEQAANATQTASNLVRTI